MTERWLPVAGLEGLYEVSDWGRVKSLRPGRWRVQTPKLLTLVPTERDSYFVVVLYRDKAKRRAYVHDLVLSAFVGPRPAGMVCRHYDGDNQNNAAGNLRWGTWLENTHDTMRHGRWKPPVPPIGEAHHSAVLTEDDVRCIRAEPYFRGVLAMLARAFDVTYQHVWRIRDGQVWAHIP